MKMKNLGQRMADRGVTQKELSDVLGCHPVTMSRYVTGQREPDIAALITMADYLGTSIDYLVGRTENPAHVTMSGADAQMLSELVDLTPTERVSFLSFVAGLKANRAQPSFPPRTERE